MANAALTELHKLISMLEDEEHNLADAFRSVFDRLRGDAPAVETEAEADGEKVAADAEHDVETAVTGVTVASAPDPSVPAEAPAAAPEA
jgi:hypothetical protein